MPPFPYPVRIGRPVDGLSGAVRPVQRPEAPTISPASVATDLCLSLLPALGRIARGDSA